MAGTYRHHTAQHARPRPPALTRALLVLGALLVTVTLGFGGYAAGTALTASPAPAAHAKVIPAPMPAHAAPAPSRHEPAPAMSPAVLHTLHAWHAAHAAHLAHLAWLRAHAVPVQTE